MRPTKANQLFLPGFEPPATQSHKEWAMSLLKRMSDRYPPSSEEWDIIISGIRLARFISHLECEKCNFATEDHTDGWVFPTLVCLKDYYTLRKRLSLHNIPIQI